MSTVQLPKPISVQVDSVYDEQIAEIVGRIQQRYPGEQISRAELEGRVRGFQRQFSTARIRTFVAIFVERLVRRSIEETSVGAPRTVAAEPRVGPSSRSGAHRWVRR